MKSTSSRFCGLPRLPSLRSLLSREKGPRYPNSKQRNSQVASMSQRSGKQNLSFLCLPLELRQYVYAYYMSNLDRPTNVKPSTSHADQHNPEGLSLCKTNQQICTEVLDVLRRERRFLYEIAPWNMGYDYISSLCLNSRSPPLSYEKYGHLKIEIHAPDSSSTFDIEHIFTHVKELLVSLTEAFTIPSLEISFLETAPVLWSSGITAQTVKREMWSPDLPKPGRALCFFGSRPSVIDIAVLVLLFAQINTARQCHLHLPPSLKDHKMVNELVQIAVETMTGARTATGLLGFWHCHLLHGKERSQKEYTRLCFKRFPRPKPQ